MQRLNLSRETLTFINLSISIESERLTMSESWAHNWKLKADRLWPIWAQLKTALGLLGAILCHTNDLEHTSKNWEGQQICRYTSLFALTCLMYLEILCVHICFVYVYSCNVTEWACAWCAFSKHIVKVEATMWFKTTYEASGSNQVLLLSALFLAGALFVFFCWSPRQN